MRFFDVQYDPCGIDTTIRGPQTESHSSLSEKSGGRLTVGSYNYVVVAQRLKIEEEEEEEETGNKEGNRKEQEQGNKHIKRNHHQQNK